MAVAPPTPVRLPRWADRLLDPALAGAMTLLLLTVAVAGATNREDGWHRVIVPLLWALSQGVPLIWRRRRPMVVLWVVVLACLAFWIAVDTRPAPLAVMVALYTVASTSDRRTSLQALGVSALIGLPYVLDTLTHLGGKYPFQLIRVGFEGAIVASAWLAGEMVRARRQYLVQLEERAVQLERERETEARRAVAEEQGRIARELHDVIAHNVSVMVVQAGAGDEVFDERPDEARAALRRIDTAGREALAELRRLLGTVLPGDRALEPQPSLERLDELIDRVRAGGLRVKVGVRGEPRRLPAGIDLSAYRIVQEALTNVMRHAQADEVDVRISYARGSVTVEVRDNGHGVVNGATPGNGIVGMRERVAMAHGTFEAGPGDGGGFSVRASLPIEEEA